MIALLGALFPLAPLALCGVTVTLPPAATVRGTELLLGDVASVRGDDPAEVERVRAISLGYAPAPGYSRVLHPVRIEQLVRGRIRDFAVEFAAAGPVRIVPETQVVTAAEIEAAARAALEADPASLASGGARVASRLVAPARDLEIPAGDAPCRLDAALARGGLRPGALRLPVRVLVDGELYRTVWTDWQIELWEERPVLARDVRAGERIDASLLTVERVPLAAAGPQALGAEKVVGTEARRDLRAGQPLTDADVLRPTLIESGDSLLLEVKNGNVSVRVPAVARQSGALGDSIQVELADGSRKLNGTVASKKLVEIDLSKDS